MSHRKKLYSKDFMEIVEIKRTFGKKTLSLRNKHIHRWELADVQPQPGFGVFNSRVFEVCWVCGTTQNAKENELNQTPDE